MGQVLVNGQPFTGASLKVGDVIDTTRGTLELRSTTGTPPRLRRRLPLLARRHARAVRARRRRLLDLPVRAPRGRKAADERPVRRLWGKGTGSFKTKARFSSATVRGTTWLTEDRCDGSLIQTDEGTVEVYDYSLRRLLLVPAGNRYLAQAPPAPTPGRFVGDPTGRCSSTGSP